MSGTLAEFPSWEGSGVSRFMGRLPRNENSRVETPEPRENIEHPTSNTERRSERGFALPFDVRRWMFDVGCSSGFMGRAEHRRGGFVVGLLAEGLGPPRAGETS